MRTDLTNETLLKVLDENQLCKIEISQASAEALAEHCDNIIIESVDDREAHFVYGTAGIVKYIISTDISIRWYHMDKIIIKDNILYSLRW